jgi:sRNA-binding regulator protein Hfq
MMEISRGPINFSQFKVLLKKYGLVKLMYKC